MRYTPLPPENKPVRLSADQLAVYREFMEPLSEKARAYFRRPVLLMLMNNLSFPEMFERRVRSIRKTADVLKDVTYYNIADAEQILKSDIRDVSNALLISLAAACAVVYSYGDPDQSQDIASLMMTPLFSKKSMTIYNPQFHDWYQFVRYDIRSQHAMFVLNGTRLECRLFREALRQPVPSLYSAISCTPMLIRPFFDGLTRHAEKLSDISLSYMQAHARAMQEYASSLSNDTAKGHTTWSSWLGNYYRYILQQYGDAVNPDVRSLPEVDFTTVGWWSYFADGYLCGTYSLYQPAPQALRWHIRMPDDRDGNFLTVRFDSIQDAELLSLLQNAVWGDAGITKRATKEYQRFTDMSARLENSNVVKDWAYLRETDCAAINAWAYSELSARDAGRFLQFMQKLITFNQGSAGFGFDRSGLRFLVGHDNHGSGSKRRNLFTDRTDDIDAAMLALAKEAENSRSAKMIFLAILIIRQTTLRMRTVAKLETDALTENAAGEFALRISHKTSASEATVPISRDAADTFRLALKTSEPYRQNCTDQDVELVNRVFLTEGKNHRTRPVTTRTISERLEKISRDCGFRNKLTAQDIRKSAIGKVESYNDNLPFGDMMSAAVTFHRSADVLRTNYDLKADEAKLLSIIEQMDADPQVIKQIRIATPGANAMPAENGIGHCDDRTCLDQDGYLPCLLCRNFYVDTGDIPALKKMIADIDADITAAASEDRHEHELDFLQTKKRLAMSYLTALLRRAAKKGA